MTMKQPRIPGPNPTARRTAEDTDCIIAAQALCHGALDTAVMAVAGAAARPGREHIALRYGRLLIYIEDRTALEALVAAVDRAQALADKVFGEQDDAFTEAERWSRRRYERTGIAVDLR